MTEKIESWTGEEDSCPKAGAERTVLESHILCRHGIIKAA